MLGSSRTNFNTATIVGRGLAFEDSFDFAELAAHFIDHLSRGTSDGTHSESAEQEGSHRANEYTYKYARVHQRHLEVFHHFGHRSL